MTNSSVQLVNMEGREYLATIGNNTVDLVLTDPPYITSRDSGMDRWMDWVASRKANGQQQYRTVAEWRQLKTYDEWKQWLAAGDHTTSPQRVAALRRAKANYLTYGSIYGNKYAIRTDYGEWDSEFTMEQMDEFVEEFYRILRPGGTCIIFFDIWKISYLKEIMERHRFKQLRFIEWVKTNPQPLNSSRNYLTNCREIALLGVKRGSPTFNSKYDKAIYEYPIQGGKWRMMPTQKSLPLCEALIEKHSVPGDLVVDPFLGAGTTAVGAANTGRLFKGCELREDMFNQMMERIEGEVNGKEE